MYCTYFDPVSDVTSSGKFWYPTKNPYIIICDSGYYNTPYRVTPSGEIIDENGRRVDRIIPLR